MRETKFEHITSASNQDDFSRLLDKDQTSPEKTESSEWDPVCMAKQAARFAELISYVGKRNLTEEEMEQFKELGNVLEDVDEEGRPKANDGTTFTINISLKGGRVEKHTFFGLTRESALSRGIAYVRRIPPNVGLTFEKKNITKAALINIISKL
jgi:hypothetical protein